uniref:Ig-like domain-containing protein n=1 Tax=Oryzias latipes TaxID=8090 RepID=A0A3P9I410_ORYLA
MANISHQGFDVNNELAGVFWAKIPMETPSKISLTKAELGDDVTLICSTKGVDRNLLSWFKYELGYVIKTVGTISYETKKMYGRFQSPRFKIIPEADGFSLSISNVSKEDEGTYLCQAGSYLTMRFINGSHLVVKGKIYVTPIFTQNVKCILNKMYYYYYYHYLEHDTSLRTFFERTFSSWCFHWKRREGFFFFFFCHYLQEHFNHLQFKEVWCKQKSCFRFFLSQLYFNI